MFSAQHDNRRADKIDFGDIRLFCRRVRSPLCRWRDWELISPLALLTWLNRFFLSRIGMVISTSECTFENKSRVNRPVMYSFIERSCLQLTPFNLSTCYKFAGRV